MTQTIGQMTDGTLFNTCGTQTARPKTSLAFNRYLNNCEWQPQEFPSASDKISIKETDLQNQIHEIKKIDLSLQQLQHNNRSNIEENWKQSANLITKSNEHLSDDSLLNTVNDDSHYHSERAFTNYLRSSNRSVVDSDLLKSHDYRHEKPKKIKACLACGHFHI